MSKANKQQKHKTRECKEYTRAVVNQIFMKTTCWKHNECNLLSITGDYWCCLLCFHEIGY